MKSLRCFADDRQKAWCIHCGGLLSSLVTNRDHVPTRSLLGHPLPQNLPSVEICKACNEGFALDEQYLVAFLGAVISGSVEPSSQNHAASARILGDRYLRTRIDRSRTTYRTVSGEVHHRWRPEQDRVDNVIVKNARGHALHELREPMLGPPSATWSFPLGSMSMSEREDFEDAEDGGFAHWPEVGSRMMQRLITGDDLDGPWIVVQEGRYRYRVDQHDGVCVRSVIHGYLATEVRWSA